MRGEFSALLQQIGSPDFFGFFDASFEAVSGQGFLQSYVTHLLLPVELPAIAEACGHTLRGELRELIAQDQRLTPQIALRRSGRPAGESDACNWPGCTRCATSGLSAATSWPSKRPG